LEENMRQNGRGAAKTLADLECEVCGVSCDEREGADAKAGSRLLRNISYPLWVKEDLGVRVEVFYVEVGGGQVVIVDTDCDVSDLSVGWIRWADTLRNC
jgi:hypothetical protein